MKTGIPSAELQSIIIRLHLPADRKSYRNRIICMTSKTHLIFILSRINRPASDRNARYACHRGANRPISLILHHRKYGMRVMAVCALNMDRKISACFFRIMLSQVTTRIVCARFVQLSPDIQACHASIVTRQAIVFFTLQDLEAFMPARPMRTMAASTGILRDGGKRPIHVGVACRYGA